MENNSQVKFEWSKEAVLQLTEMWQKYEFLYNRKHKFYRNQKARHQAYNDMANKLKIFNTNIEAIDVKTKITYLRGQYAREVAKEKKRGASADQVYVPSAYWFHQLSFLDDFIKVRKECSNVFERMDSRKINENLCVICLDDNVILDWNENVAELCNMSYKDCYYKYTKLQPSTLDSFPSNLCKICSNGLRKAHLLFEKAFESFKFLQEALTNKEEFDMEINTSQDTMNFEIKILDVCESNDLIEEESLTDDKTLIDIEDEIICPTNAYDNVVRIENAINDSISKEMHMHEDEIIEHGAITPIANSEPSSEILLEQELSQSSDTIPTTSSTTVKVRQINSYLCAYCSLKVNNKSTLRTHEATHSENRKRTETCPKCGIKFYTKMALKNHMRIHEENRQKKYKCEFCDKEFFNRGALNVHRRIHLGQMVPCRLCPKEFFRQVDLDRHLLRHSATNLQKKDGKRLMDSLKLNGNICRICLDDNVTINWSEEIVEFSGISYKDCYYKYTELQQSSVDPFPTNLCETCSNGLKNTHLLFEKALESLKILQECLTTEELAQTPVSCLKKDLDVELSRSQPIMNFQIKVIENFKNKNDIFEDETLGNDKSLIDIDDEILCPINACDNDSVVEESSITNSSNVQDATIEPVHFIEMPNYDSPAEDLLEQKLSESCDKDSQTSTNTKKSAKSRRNPFYICSYCSLKADSIAVLKRHEATHSENRERTETCPHCEVKLYNKMALRVHMEIHTENRQKKFKCEFCEKAFFNRGALNVHRRIHLGQMVTCRLCPKEFYRQIDLDKHLLMRHSAAPIQTKVPQLKYTVQCQYCDKTVPTTKWKEHKAAHLNQPQVKCKVCDKKFFARVKCVRHLQRVHHKTQDQYETFIHYYDDYKTRISHLMIQQQEKVQSVTN